MGRGREKSVPVLRTGIRCTSGLEAYKRVWRNILTIFRSAVLGLLSVPFFEWDFASVKLLSSHSYVTTLRTRISGCEVLLPAHYTLECIIEPLARTSWWGVGEWLT